ncbi:MAG: hypothetical protein EZS28_018652, partial [Streblomastix strix]
QGDENPQVHAIFIKDIDRVVGGCLCRKCNQKLFNRTSAHFGKDLKTHLESCKGPDQQKHPKLDKLAQPFMPYLKSNKTIQKLFTIGQTKLFPKDQEQGVSDILQPTKNYMCIDAETVEEHQREAQAQDDEQIYAQLQPLSIVIGTLIKNKIYSKYIDIRTQDFMNKFIEQMWELVNEVNEANLACEPIVKFDNENEQQKHQQKIHQVAIFGFNSKNNAYLGSTTQQKQVTIRHTDYPFELVFKDVLTFIPPTTLDNFVHKYGNGTKLIKGKFLHGSFNTNNVNQFLSSTETFEHKDFYNYISRKNISNKEYQENVDDFNSLDVNGNRKFKDRWLYLEFYNIRDVVSNSIKYYYAWEDFDINGDYNIETGPTHINKLKYNPEENNVTAYDLDYFITHILDLDFNSLYPSAFCGIYNKNNPYTGGKMCMAGRVTKHIKIREANNQDYRDTKRKEMMNIISSEDRFSEEKGQLIIASVKGHIEKSHINEHINFLPIWRKRTYKTDEKSIGKFTFEKMQKYGISVNKLVTKLTSLLSTHDEFMSFSSYYLWLLIDYCHFIIDDVEEIVLFTKHTAFKSFVEVMAEKSQQAMREGNQAKQLYFKNIVNSSYGADGQNNEKFDKIGFTNTRKNCDDRYLVSINLDSFSAHKCLQVSIFTQDNSKFWYLCFIYFFLYKCIDMDRIHFCCMDTDSMYLAISGSTIEGYKQQFKHVIKDQQFWDEHYKEWLPWEGCTIAEEKKLLGCTIESQRESIICLAPKCYSAIDEEVDDVIRMKGVNEKNSGLTRDDYINCIENNSNISVPVTQIQLKNGVMSMVKITKSALTGVVDKMIVIDSDIFKGQSYPCAPQIMNVDASKSTYYITVPIFYEFCKLVELSSSLHVRESSL